MITKDTIKHEIDQLQDEYIEIVYRVIKALEMPKKDRGPSHETRTMSANWDQFIEQTYGCLADAPIVRGDQGEFEARETL